MGLGRTSPGKRVERARNEGKDREREIRLRMLREEMKRRRAWRGTTGQ